MGSVEGLKDMESKEWENEPDKVEFEYLGFKCLILRNPELKTLNGYIGLPKSHPYYGKDYNDIDVEVHGGLTFSGQGGRWDKHYWWIGFDCAHAGDLMPGADIPGRITNRWDLSYRNIEYVKNELKHLAEQLTDEGMLERELKRR